MILSPFFFSNMLRRHIYGRGGSSPLYFFIPFCHSCFLLLGSNLFSRWRVKIMQRGIIESSAGRTIPHAGERRWLENHDKDLFAYCTCITALLYYSKWHMNVVSQKSHKQTLWKTHLIWRKQAIEGAKCVIKLRYLHNGKLRHVFRAILDPFLKSF